MYEWRFPHRVARARSTAQALYLTERSCSRYVEYMSSWETQFEVERIDKARRELESRQNARSERILANSRYFRPLSFVF